LADARSQQTDGLVLVRDSISAVISTACAWCMIIICINSTSFGETGGSFALVDEGSTRVGCPGAPGLNYYRRYPGISLLRADRQR
jgi:hypothetical protein